MKRRISPGRSYAPGMEPDNQPPVHVEHPRRSTVAEVCNAVVSLALVALAGYVAFLLWG